MDPIAITLYDALKRIRVHGPDQDGQLRLEIDSDEDVTVLLVAADSPQAPALIAWREAAAAALAAAELAGIR